MQKKSKITIGWVLASVAALAVGLLTFFSFNFQYLGENVVKSVLWATIITLAMLGVVIILVKVKKVPMPLNFQKAALCELLLLVVYIACPLATIFLTNHFFVVMQSSGEIKKEVESQISQIDGMFKSYNQNVDNRVEAYDTYLQVVEQNKNSNVSKFVDEQLNEYTREDLVINFKGDIECANMQERVTQWKETTRSRTTGLGLITLLPRIKEINTTLEQTREELKERDRLSEKGLNGPHWDYPLSTSNDIIKHYEKKDGEKLSIWSVIVSIFAAFVILLPYIAAERDGRHKGFFHELFHKREPYSGYTTGI